MRLSELRTGEKGVIVKVLGHGGFRKRIVEMGFIKGKTVEVILNAPLKDPIKYRLLGYEISLRRQEADMIEVVSEQEARTMQNPYHGSITEDVPVSESELVALAKGKRRTINVALVGNPNCGKTSLFNIASGAHEHVGNYSGVTVDAKELIAKGLVDTLMYRPQMNEFLKAKVGIDKDDDLIFASINEVASIKQAPNKAKDEIAIVYAEGGIDMGETNGVNTAKLVKDLTKIQNDKNVKAVVLRVNSPGGSAYGSEQVWAAIEAIKAAGKPVAVSMGDVAASGGYYISCNADRIFANPTTLTGSIGIYGLIPNYKGLLTGKLGLTFDGVQTNKYGNFPSVSRAMTTDEHRQMQQYIERGYELFTTRCAEGRVWDGATALEIGLVDELGDLDAAIEWVAQKAKLDKYKTSAYPKQKTAMEQLMDELGMNVRSKIAASYLGENYKYFKALEQCQNIDPVQYRMEDIELY